MEMGRLTLLSDFFQDLELRNVSRTQIYISYVGEFCQFLQDRGKTPEQADKTDLRAYLQLLKDRNLKQSSLSRAFSCLSQFYAYLVDEDLIASNPISPFRKRYLRSYKNDSSTEPRQLISVEQAAMLVNAILSARDRAIVMLLLKTGMRRGELVALDLADIDLPDMSLMLKPTAKRSNRQLFFDNETARVLKAWLDVRDNWRRADAALFPSTKSNRANPMQIDWIVERYAQMVGLHDPTSKSLQRRFTPHCCRHWLVTHLLRAGMSRDHVKWIRGDAMKESIDIYYHIDPKDVRQAYLAYIPQLGV